MTATQIGLSFRGVAFPRSPTLQILAAAVLIAAAQAQTPEGHPFHLAQVEAFPHEFLLRVEIPADGRVEYEIDPACGLLFVDRFLQMCFRECKRIPAGAAVEVGNFEDAEAARQALVESMERYRRERSRTQ